MTNSNLSLSYIDRPCERCGSKIVISKSWQEELKTALGTSVVEILQTVCTNTVCQEEFDKNREKELAKINARKVAKEEQDKIRKENIAKTIAERKRAK